MWKALLLLAFVASFGMVISCDDDGPPTITTESPQKPDCGCGGHPPKCGKNEEYNDCSCPTPCQPTKCSELGFPLKCDKKCKPGCVCKDGYVRDDNGVCIPKKECCSCGGDNNATSGCGIHCGKTCATYKTGDPMCALARFACNPNGCDCKNKYVFDTNIGKCVRPEDCTPTCKVNEEYSPCSNGGCDMRNCSQIGQPKVCIDPECCIQGCVCVKGYLRAANGTCVPIDKCPQKCCKNEEYNDCSCPTPCQPTKCSELGFPLKCDKKCKPGCVCKDGYVRDDNGVCILKKECCSCGGDKNARSGCGINCGKTCATCNVKNPVCPLICKLNGCDCKVGYVFDANVGKCVRPKDCTPTCKVNEEYSPCSNGGCDIRNCSQIGQKKVCIDPECCIKGCVCVKGYLRDANGICVPIKKCPPPDCPPGEIFFGCPTVKCDGDWCQKYRDSPFSCPIGIVCDKPRCDCDYNRKRDWKTGKCILIKDCPPFKCDCNEEYQACQPLCPSDKCSDKNNKQICPKPDIKENCRPQCRCSKGYCRNKDGKCVPECETPTCKVNEEYSPCSNGGCGYKKCSDLGQPEICIDPVKCIKGCVCVKGYLRAANGTCVPIDECPTPTCPSGEKWHKCPGVICDGNWCQKYRDSPFSCPIGTKCDKPRCVCDYNRKRDWKTGKCILIKDCPPFKCDCNEEYQACQPLCPSDKCSDKNNKQICPKIGIIANCRPQCRCSKGYCRNKDGKCVPDCECHGDS